MVTVVNSLGFIFAPYILDWLLKIPATWTHQQTQTNKTSMKACSLELKDQEKNSLAIQKTYRQKPLNYSQTPQKIKYERKNMWPNSYTCQQRPSRESRLPSLPGYKEGTDSPTPQPTGLVSRPDMESGLSSPTAGSAPQPHSVRGDDVEKLDFHLHLAVRSGCCLFSCLSNVRGSQLKQKD